MNKPIKLILSVDGNEIDVFITQDDRQVVSAHYYKGRIELIFGGRLVEYSVKPGSIITLKIEE